MEMRCTRKGQIVIAVLTVRNTGNRNFERVEHDLRHGCLLFDTKGGNVFCETSETGFSVTNCLLNIKKN
jgi:hypothetical protein